MIRVRRLTGINVPRKLTREWDGWSVKAIALKAEILYGESSRMVTGEKYWKMTACVTIQVETALGGTG